jgi:hypothetical protein
MSFGKLEILGGGLGRFLRDLVKARYRYPCFTFLGFLIHGRKAYRQVLIAFS